MNLKRVRKLLTSIRTTLGILLVLAGLLLLHIVIPQAPAQPVGTPEPLPTSLGGALIAGLGLDHIPTSPLFLAALTAFYVNLTAVLVHRTRATIKRTRVVPPTESRIESWLAREAIDTFPRPPGWNRDRVARVLTALGYRVARPGPNSSWAIKNRTSILGFPIFHLSFFVLTAGALMLYYTRFDGIMVLAEGQTFEGGYAAVMRQMSWTRTPVPAVTLHRVDPRLEDGRPVQLGATVTVSGVIEEPVTAWINDPVVWSDNTLLIEKAGIAPVLWLQDGQGFTRDRVTAITANLESGPPRIPLAEGELLAVVKPMSLGPDFPVRDQLDTTPINLTVSRPTGETLFEGEVRPGQVVTVGSGFLKLEEVRYWAYMRLVQERGGALLILGFLLGVAGLVWRMVWYRREVAVGWDDAQVRLTGRSDYFAEAFREELREIATLLKEDETDQGRKDP